MPQTLDFYFDFGSPNAYLAWRVLPGIAERTGADIRFRPVLLGGIFKATGNKSPMMAFSEVRGKLAYEQLEMERFIRKHAITDFQFNPHFPLNTITLMRGAIVAGERGELPAYVRAVFEGVWEEGRKMDDLEVVVGTLDGKGLDGTGLVAATEEPAVKDALRRATDEAVERGIFGLPTFFVGDEMFFGKERLGQVEEMLGKW